MKVRRDDDPGGAVALQPSHRSKSGLPASVVSLDAVVRTHLRVYSRPPAAFHDHLDTQTERFHQLHLTGSYPDVLGEQHQVDETFELSQWWEFLKAALHRVQTEWQEEVPRTLGDIEKSLAAIGRTLQSYVKWEQEGETSPKRLYLRSNASSCA